MYKILISILLFNFLLSQDYPAPINLNSYVDNGSINLDWGEITHNDITGYYIYRNNESLLLQSNNNYSDIDVLPETAYCYTITALYINENESEHSNMSCTSWQINPPINFSLEPGNQEVHLAWEAPETHNEYTIGYHDNWTDDAIGDTGPLDYSPIIRFTPEQLQDIGINENDKRTIRPLDEVAEEFKITYIREALEINNWNKAQTARDLDIDPRTVFRYIEKFKGI